MTRTDALAVNVALRGSLAAAERQVRLLSEVSRAASAEAFEQAETAAGLDDVARGLLGAPRAEVAP